MDTTGRRIAKLRGALRYSQTEFGECVQVTQGTVSDWETGKTSPALGYVRLMADLAGDPQPVFKWLQEGGDPPRLSPVPSGAEVTARVSGTPKAANAILGRLRALHREQSDLLEALDELLG